VRDRVRFWQEEPLVAVALEARALAPLRRRQFAEWGTGSILHRPLWLYGTRHAAVGNHCLVMHQAWIAVERSAWHLPEPALRIGNRVTLRPFVCLSASVSVAIEDDVVFGAGCGVYDSDHTSTDVRPNVLDNPSVARPVRIGAGAWLGDRVTVLAGSDIGEGCVIGAGSVVKGHIPAHSVAVGAPARVIRTTAAG
jgi:acetyltransferase-like isoleucine patch superfamily enzyme